jgi:hypothetical protein
MRFSITRRLAVLGVVFAGAMAAAHVAAGPPANVDNLAVATAPAERVPPTTAPPGPPDRALLISDSAWLGIKLYGSRDAVQGFDHTMALASCRRRVSTSCTNFDGFIPITLHEELDNHPTDYTTLIVATGYNDGDQSFVQDVASIVALARAHDYRRIVWLTLRANVSYTSPDGSGFAEVFERTNATLRQIVDAGTYPEIVIADWATYTVDQPQWFATDGIHLRGAGAFAASDYISRKMAFLDETACAQPTFAGFEPLDPCPDPDDHGPLIDLESIYPIGEPYPLEDFTLVWEGSSSWPNPPWWEL